MRGPQNGDSIGDILEGQAWTLSEANVAFDESISGYLSLDCALSVSGCYWMHDWSLYSFEILMYWFWWLIILTKAFDVVTLSMLHCYICLWHLTCWLWWSIILIRDPDVAIISVLHCYICLRHVWDVGMLIDHLTLLSISDSDFAMFVLVTSHACTHHCISFGWTCWFICLYIILIVLEHDVYVTICLDCRFLAYFVCTWGYIWALSDYMLHDCHFSVWLHVACLCG